MPDYRVYLLPEQFKIRKATWVQSDTLDGAMLKVSAELPGVTCEIWEGAHCLVTVLARFSF